MDRTLFSPTMIDTFRACKRAFTVAFSRYYATGKAHGSLSSLCKSFIRRGVAAINQGKLRNTSQVQIFIGQHWPLAAVESLGLGGDRVARAFLFSYKTLCGYLRRSYRPPGSEVASVSLKVRARALSARVYLEETFDMVLWYPRKQHLEIVEYVVETKAADDRQSADRSDCPASLVAKHFLLKKLRARWAYETASLTTISLSPSGMKVSKTHLDEELLDYHWESVEQDLEMMKSIDELSAHAPEDNCRYCHALRGRVQEPVVELAPDPDEEPLDLSMSA